MLRQIATLFGMPALTFLLVNAVPGDVARVIAATRYALARD